MVPFCLMSSCYCYRGEHSTGICKMQGRRSRTLNTLVLLFYLPTVRVCVLNNNFAQIFRPVLSISPHKQYARNDEPTELPSKGISPNHGSPQDLPRILRTRRPTLRVCPGRGSPDEGERVDFDSHPGENAACPLRGVDTIGCHFIWFIYLFTITS